MGGCTGSKTQFCQRLTDTPSPGVCGKCLTTSFLKKHKQTTLICSICQFPWCKFPPQLIVSCQREVILGGIKKRCTQFGPKHRREVPRRQHKGTQPKWASAKREVPGWGAFALNPHHKLFEWKSLALFYSCRDSGSARGSNEVHSQQASETGSHSGPSVSKGGRKASARKMGTGFLMHARLDLETSGGGF